MKNRVTVMESLKITVMEKQIEKIQKFMGLIGVKNYKAAFDTIYGNNLTNYDDYDEIVSTLMVDRCNGDFFKACRIYENMILQEEEAMEKALKSSKVKCFTAEYQEFESGYAMGEIVYVKAFTRHRTKWQVIKDTRETYVGRGRRFNKSVSYGKAALIIDLSGNRAKYDLVVHKK